MSTAHPIKPRRLPSNLEHRSKCLKEIKTDQSPVISASGRSRHGRAWQHAAMRRFAQIRRIGQQFCLRFGREMNQTDNLTLSLADVIVNKANL